MRVVFDVHNDFGRLFDEDLYKCEVAARCLDLGLEPAEREVRIRVRHETFVKDYFMDLLFCHAFMLEAKAADRLAPTHRGQSLNYLLLAGLKHGRLVNLRSERVEHEFVSTSLTAEERRKFRVLESDWLEPDKESAQLKSKTTDLLHDWGAFLDVNLYREALIHFLGGPARVCKAVEIFSGTRCVGTQTFNLLSEETAFAFTMKTQEVGAMRDHLTRLLYHTRLKSIQWINLNKHLVEFSTIAKTR